MSNIELEYWEGCEDFARVLEAAAEDHNFSYCEGTPAEESLVAKAAKKHLASVTDQTNTTEILHGKTAGMAAINALNKELSGKPVVSKPPPMLNLANSRIFKRRFGTTSEASVATGAFGVIL